MNHSIPTVLIIDDDPSIRQLLKDILEEYTAFTFRTGDEAIVWMQQNVQTTVTLALCDYCMPGHNGLETLGAIRQRSPDTQLVLMSETFAGDLERLVRERTFDCFVTKPFDGEMVRTLVADQIRRKKPDHGEAASAPAERIVSDPSHPLTMLRRIRAFAVLSDAELERLAPYLRKIQAFAMESLVQRGIDMTTTYFVHSGSVELLVSVDEGMRMIETINAGEVFAELALCGRHPSPFLARARELSVLFALRRADFEAVRREHPELASRILLAVATDVSLRQEQARERLLDAKVMVRGHLGRTGRVLVPIVKKISTANLGGAARPVKSGSKGRRAQAGFDPAYFVPTAEELATTGTVA